MQSTTPPLLQQQLPYKSPLLSRQAASTSSPKQQEEESSSSSNKFITTTIDFVSPLLPRELEVHQQQHLYTTTTNTTTTTTTNTNTNSVNLNKSLPHLSPNLLPPPPPFPPTPDSPISGSNQIHAPFQPIHHSNALGTGNREYEQLMRIYGWQESSTRTSGPICNPDQIYGNHLLALSSVNLPTSNTTRLNHSSGYHHQSNRSSAESGKDSGWTSAFLGKFSRTSKSGTPKPDLQLPNNGVPLKSRGSASSQGAFSALSSLAKRTAIMTRDPLAGFIPSTSRRGSNAGIQPINLNLPPPPPLSAIKINNNSTTSIASFNNGSPNIDKNFYSDPLDADTDGYVVQGDSSQVIMTPCTTMQHAIEHVLTHRRSNSDQTIRSVSASIIALPQQRLSANNTQARYLERGAPIRRHDSGVHTSSTIDLLPKGYRPVRKGSIDSVAPSAIPLALPKLTPSRKSTESSTFRTYRLTQAYPSSGEMTEDGEDEGDVAIEDDEDEHKPRPAAGSTSDPSRTLSFVPPPRTSSFEQGTQQGDFGLPPSNHSFWTNPRIFDSVPAVIGDNLKPGQETESVEVPPVIWEVSPHDGVKKLMAATPVKLIEVLTTTLDYQFLTDFFLVYRAFMTPLQLALMLILRFRWAMMNPNSGEHALVRFRTFIVLRHWITDYYIQDFAGCRALRYLMIITFINVIAEDPIIRSHPRDYRLVKTLKRLLRAQDQEYKHLKQLYAQTRGGVVTDLANWVHQLSVEKHFEAVYYPILSLVKDSHGGSSKPGSARGSIDDGYSRDSGISRMGSGSHIFKSPIGSNVPPISQPLRGSSTESTAGLTHAMPPGTPHSPVAVADVPAALAALVCTKRSFLLHFKLETVAEQFLLIEEMMLLSIPWSALPLHASKAGKDKNHAGSASSEDRGPVQAMIDRFNATCQWVATEVCSQKNMEDRVKVIEKLVRLAVRSQVFGNLSTVNQIALGLQNPYVERLRKTWTKVSSVEKKQLRDLITLTAPMKNFSPLRAAMASELERSNGIPFTGVLLSDLVYNREMPSTLGKSTLNLKNLVPSPAAPTPSSSSLVALPVINYHKFRVMATTLDQFRQFQRIKRPPGRNALDVDVYANCLCLRTVPNPELQRLSYDCERKS